MQKFIIKKQSPTSMIIELDCNKLSAAEQITLFGKEFSKKAPNEELVFIQKNDFVFSIDRAKELFNFKPSTLIDAVKSYARTKASQAGYQ